MSTEVSLFDYIINKNNSLKDIHTKIINASNQFELCTCCLIEIEQENYYCSKHGYTCLKCIGTLNNISSVHDDIYVCYLCSLHNLNKQNLYNIIEQSIKIPKKNHIKIINDKFNKIMEVISNVKRCKICNKNSNQEYCIFCSYFVQNTKAMNKCIICLQQNINHNKACGYIINGKSFELYEPSWIVLGENKDSIINLKIRTDCLNEKSNMINYYCDEHFISDYKKTDYCILCYLGNHVINKKGSNINTCIKHLKKDIKSCYVCKKKYSLINEIHIKKKLSNLCKDCNKL